MRWTLAILGLVACGEPALEHELQAKYDKSCAACHEAGAADAPRRGDSEDWAPRLARGEDALFTSVSDGMVSMPPGGMCADCTDDELRLLIRHLAGVR
jgi:cytochrome c5